MEFLDVLLSWFCAVVGHKEDPFALRIQIQRCRSVYRFTICCVFFWIWGQFTRWSIDQPRMTERHAYMYISMYVCGLRISIQLLVRYISHPSTQQFSTITSYLDRFHIESCTCSAAYNVHYIMSMHTTRGRARALHNARAQHVAEHMHYKKRDHRNMTWEGLGMRIPPPVCLSIHQSTDTASYDSTHITI